MVHAWAADARVPRVETAGSWVRACVWAEVQGRRVGRRRSGVAGLGGVGAASRPRCAGGERGKERRRGRKKKMEKRKKEKEKERGRKREGRDASAPTAASGRAWPIGGRAARDETAVRKKREGTVGGKEMTTLNELGCWDDGKIQIRVYG